MSPPRVCRWAPALLVAAALIATTKTGVCKTDDQQPASASAPSAAKIELDPAKVEIIAGPGPVSRFAAEELHKHLAIITGVDVPVASSLEPPPSRRGSVPLVPAPQRGRFPIYVGVRPPDDTTPFHNEEARWQITTQAVSLYGDDTIAAPQPTVFDTVMRYENHAGSLFAVYEFLERYLGVRWTAPGDSGITFEPQATLALPAESGDWTPALNQRHIRSCYREVGDRDPDGIEVRPLVLANGDVPYAFILPAGEFLQRRNDELVWHRRMRMGRSEPLSYGHAFTQWWRKYGQTHPEYFALNRYGRREPSRDIVQGAPERVKLCVSNPDVVREIVRQHFANGGGPVVDACENDNRGFCRCAACQAWDVLRPGEEKLDMDQRPLTDRYLRFANAVEAEAKKYNPAAKTAFYAYSQYKFPPRREKVADGVLIFFITDQTTPDAQLDAYYDAWKAAGAKEVYLRPNHLCDDTGLPLGFEENMYDKFQVIRRHFPLTGVDYDCSWGMRPVSGIAEYILARTFYAPDRPFSYWENEYCATFGSARPEIRDYYRYWRQIWNQRIEGNRERFNRLSGKLKEMRDRLMQLTDLLYSEDDFDRTDALLAGALKHNDLAPSVRVRIEQIQLANQHSRLTYRARKANELISTADADEKAAATRTLLAFRQAHRDELDLYWEGLFWMENVYNDVGGDLRLTGRQGKRYADWGEQMAASIRQARTPNESPLR